MVTLQILVLSFLVRIQVAQLRTIFARRSFFCFYRCWCKRVVVPTIVVERMGFGCKHCAR